MTSRSTRFWLVLLAMGLSIEIVALLAFQPGTFVVFAMIGVPAIGLSALVFAVRGVRMLVSRNIL